MKLASTLSPRSPGNASTGLTMNTLPIEKQIQVISALTEGCSIRSTERLTGVNRNTVMSLNVRVGDGCERLHDHLMRDLQVNQIELDEQWDFIQKKQKRVRSGDPSEFGDVWLFVALAATQKAVLSYLVGKRSTENTNALARDLRARIVNRPQITSDGYAPYVGAVESAFGWDVDYAMLTKQYVGDSNLPDAAHRYSPGHVAGIEKTVIRGRPDEDAPIHAAEQRILEKAGKPLRSRRVMDQLLQSLPRARNAALYARDGAWRERSYLDDCGACAGCANAARRAAVARSDAAIDAQTRIYAIEAESDPRRKSEQAS